MMKRSLSEKGSKETKYSWSALLDIRIVLNVLMVMSTFIIVGFNDATLAMHLKQFRLSPTNTGLSFIVCGGLYSVSSIFWGIMSKRVVSRDDDKKKTKEEGNEENEKIADFWHEQVDSSRDFQLTLK